MTKDFEARALKKAEESYQEWMDSGDYTPRNQYKHFFMLGARYGRAEGLDEAAGIVNDPLRWGFADLLRLIAEAIRAKRSEADELCESAKEKT